MFRLLGLVVEARVFFLQVPGVGQHNAAQIDGRRRRIDRAAKAFFHQAWNPAAVVEMGVSEETASISAPDRRVLPVALAPLFGSLKQAAVDQNLKAALPGRRC